jgi:deoxyribodipyrimidine photo-lyase
MRCARRAHTVPCIHNFNLSQALSNLSPYFHFGQLSVQRAALEARKHKQQYAESVDSFLEEAVVRRELSDNFCFYEPNYDQISCASDWARESLDAHRKDKREHLYTR